MEEEEQVEIMFQAEGTICKGPKLRAWQDWRITKKVSSIEHVR